MNNVVRYLATFLVVYLLLAAGCQRQSQPPANVTAIPEAKAEPTATVPVQSTLIFTPIPTPTEEMESTVQLSPLTIESNVPDAHIYLNQVDIGRIPYSTLQPTGAYTLTAILPGFHPWQHQFFLDENEPATFTAEFSFEPEIEKLIDSCVQHAWWSDDGDAIYYVHCSPIGTSFQETGQRYEEGPIWRFDLMTNEITQIEDAWPPEWVPRQYQDIVPNSIPHWRISVSPSGQRVLYLEEFSVNTTSDSSDTQAPSLPEFIVHVVLDNETVLNLGLIDSIPERISWSRDEEIIFMSSYAYAPHKHEGWLIELENQQMKALAPPEIDGREHTDFFNATITPNGEAILYRIDVQLPYLLWYFKSEDERELTARMGWYDWLQDDRYLLFSNSEGVFWYDLANELIIPVLDAGSSPGMDLQRLSPAGDRMLFTKFSLTTGDNLDGLWMLTLDSQ